MARLTYSTDPGDSSDEMSVTYFVECIWPSNKFGEPGVPEPEKERWGRYTPTAWNDKNEPSEKRWFGSAVGDFDKIHADVAVHPSRLSGNGAAGERSPAFTDPQAALAYARRLQEFGECASRFSDGGTQESRDLQYKGREIRTRVVEQYDRTRQRVVLA